MLGITAVRNDFPDRVFSGLPPGPTSRLRRAATTESACKRAVSARNKLRPTVQSGDSADVAVRSSKLDRGQGSRGLQAVGVAFAVGDKDEIEVDGVERDVLVEVLDEGNY